MDKINFVKPHDYSFQKECRYIYTIMKKFLALFLILSALPLLAVPAQETTLDSYTYNNLIARIDKVGAPFMVDDYIIFTADSSSRHVGIAFDFENFKTIHSFQKVNTTDLDGTVVQSVYFYILEVPKALKAVSYRLVIDGLWTVDPSNKQQRFDAKSNLILSTVAVQRQEIPATETVKKNLVRFVYQGQSGQVIRLGGTFTNWDSSIYIMRETAPGLYELEIPLPRGTHYYAYYDGMASFVDKTNPERAYTTDGRTASVITIN